jgi:hypothetical protein
MFASRITRPKPRARAASQKRTESGRSASQLFTCHQFQFIQKHECLTQLRGTRTFMVCHDEIYRPKQGSDLPICIRRSFKTLVCAFDDVGLRRAYVFRDVRGRAGQPVMGSWVSFEPRSISGNFSET